MIIFIHENTFKRVVHEVMILLCRRIIFLFRFQSLNLILRIGQPNVRLINQSNGWPVIDPWSHSVHISACSCPTASVRLLVFSFLLQLFYTEWYSLFTASRDPACHTYSLVRLYSITLLINSFRSLRHIVAIVASLPWTSIKKAAKGPISISDKTSHRKISRILEALRMVV